MIVIWAILTFFLVGGSQGSDGCFVRHIDEAIELNRERLPLYAEMNSRSKNISRQLILMEIFLRPAARLLMGAATPYQVDGGGFMCDEFIEIAETPPFQESKIPLTDPLSEDVEPPGDNQLQRLREAMDRSDYSNVVQGFRRDDKRT